MVESTLVPLTLSGRAACYELMERLGAGGMGEVWRVRHRTLGVERALKVLLRPTPSHQASLWRESRVQRRICHSRVVPVLDLLPTSRGMAMLMPVVEGPSLARWLSDHVRPTAQSAACLLLELLGALGAVHEARVVHRDVKPSNLLLTRPGPDGRVMLADFGVARDLREGPPNDPPSVVGTIAYAPPEQLGSAIDVTPAADLWAVGVLAYRLVTGRLPFGSHSVPSVRHAQHRGMRLPGELDPLLTAWDPLVRGLLHADPSARLDRLSAAEMLSDLAAGHDGRLEPGNPPFEHDLPPAVAPTVTVPWGTKGHTASIDAGGVHTGQ